MSCCSHVPLIDPWGQTQYPSWLNVIEFVSYLQEFCRHQRTNQILPVSGGVCHRLSDMRRLPSSWAWPRSKWIIWKRKTPKTWQWPTASRNEPDSWTTLYSTCLLSLSSSLIPSYPLRFWDVLFSTNLSGRSPPRVLVACLRGTPTNAESLPRLAWLISTVPAWSEHMPPALLLYAHSKQIKTISRWYATRSAILVLAADCVWHRRWDKTLIKRVCYYMTAGLRKFPSQESTSWHWMDSAWTLLSETIFRHFEMVSCHTCFEPYWQRGAAVYRLYKLDILPQDVENLPSEVKVLIQKEKAETMQLKVMKVLNVLSVG